MSDRIAVLSQGQVQQVGTPEEIQETPANRFAAGFVGDANFVGAKVFARTGTEAECRTDGGLTLKADARRAHMRGKAASLPGSRARGSSMPIRKRA